MGPWFLAEMTWTEVRDALGRTNTAILPVGATEAHGPHLTLATDSIIATETARRAALDLAGRGVEVLVLPTLDYGVCQVAAPFPGTVGISPETMIALVSDLGLSLARQGVRHLCISSHHYEGAHLNCLDRAAAIVVADSGANVAVVDKRHPLVRATTEPGVDCFRHAGMTETSLVLAVQPELVREEVMRTLPPNEASLMRGLARGATTFGEAGGTEAYFGDPAAASAAAAEATYAMLARAIAETVCQMRSATAG